MRHKLMAGSFFFLLLLMLLVTTACGKFGPEDERGFEQTQTDQIVAAIEAASCAESN